MSTEVPPASGIGHVMDILTGHWKARILLTAVENDLFERLSGRSATAAEIAGLLSFQPSAIDDFIGALVHLRLLESGSDGYRNSSYAESHLVRGGNAYIGGYVRFCDTDLNPAWDGLTETLRTGAPTNKAAASGSNPYDSLYQDRKATEMFLDSMDLAATPSAIALSGLDWSQHKSFVDVGGARGHLAKHIVAAHPHLEAVVFDLPPLEEAFDNYMAALGAPPCISFQSGDFFVDPLPQTDAVVFGHVLHNWAVDERIQLLRNAYQAIRPGGSVFVYDHMVGAATPSFNKVMSSLSMRVWSAGGHEYSVAECHEWLRTAGFHPVTSGLPDLGDDVLVVAHKPS